MAKSVVLSGYYGSGNLGDDALMLGVLANVKQEEFAIQVLSGNPQETNRLYGVPAVQRKELTTVKAAIQNSDALVFGGGSIFQDVTSVKSVLYYASLISHAKKYKRRVILLGQGIGPLTSFLGKKFARAALQAADIIAVRDEDSHRALHDLGVKGRISVTGDLAFLLPKPNPDSNVDSFQVGDRRTVGVAARPFGDRKTAVVLIAETCRALYDQGFWPVLLEMDREMDGPFIMDVDKASGGKAPSIRRIGSPMEFQQRVQRMEALVSVRLHGAILGASLGIPSVMIDYDPKVRAFSKQLDLPCLPIKSLTATRVVDAIKEIMSHRDATVARLAKKVEVARDGALKNIDLLRESLA